MIGTTAYQMATRPSYDLELSFYAEKMLSEESVAKLEQYIAGFMEDVDGDGEVTVKIYTNFASILGERSWFRFFGFAEVRLLS